MLPFLEIEIPEVILKSILHYYRPTLKLAAFLMFLYLLLWRLTVGFEWIKEKNRILKLASLIPGPRSVQTLEIAWHFATEPENLIPILSKFIDRYRRGIFKIWLGSQLTVIVTRPNEIEAVLGNTKQFQKSSQYEVMRHLMSEGLVVAENMKKWKTIRKVLTPAFHFSILNDFLPKFYNCATALAYKIEENVGKPLKVQMEVSQCTLNSICITALGVSENPEIEKVEEFLKNKGRVFTIWHLLCTRVWYNLPIIFTIFNLISKYGSSLKVCNSFVEDLMKKIKEERGNKKDKANSKLEAGEKKIFPDLMWGSGTSDEVVKDEVMGAVLAGNETVANSISLTILLLAIHKDVQKKVHEELFTVFGGDKYSVPNRDDLNKLEYLERVIKETIRLYPPIPYIGRNLENDLKIGDYVIPKSTDVGILIHSVHRDPQQWEEPDTFNPDRFLPKYCKSRHPYSYIPFSAGLRSCVGQKYGVLQMKTILSTLLRKFTFTAGPEYKTINDIEIIVATTIKPKKEFSVIFEHK